ncbi:MAG: SRPBCC family protein [Ilumatobacteraceae bacterium]
MTTHQPSDTPPAPPLTFRSGPSDPIRFADGVGTHVAVTIAAPASVVWPIVTDLDTPAPHSDEYSGGTWIDAGPALGARFTGRNANSTLGEWDMISHIDRYEPERVFGWATNDVDNPGATWCFVLEPNQTGTDLRFELRLGPGPSGLTSIIDARPELETRILMGRLRQLHDSMQRTVEGIRQIAESNADPDPATPTS